ncbi:SCP2 domain-containing protein [Psychromonas marina]|uniref:Ubiquinone biosynthesis accessory factor UbiJ n=1 Tax=Psychromonas marina TaxID=88364 RepID=A0ABQ6E5D5_9GAMM|nr:SCP2 sterol-binding domain-containing protein [Psychromonas marina]GLS92627.1 SCP2 domain-containing protein [Psychromonas marina]
MPLDNLVCGLLETGVNKLHQLDSSAKQKRKALDGTIIGVSLKEINKPLYFVISNQQIDLLSQFEGQPDCFIRVNFLALIELQDNHQLTNLIKSGQLEVDGDIKTVQKFAQLLTEMDIDWEEHLSKKVGDLLAHKIVYHAKQCKKTFTKQSDKAHKQLTEIITEELKVAPGPLEVAYFCDQVSDIEKQVAALEKQLARY